MRVTFRCDPALEAILPRPVLARETLPEWLRRMAPRNLVSYWKDSWNRRFRQLA